MINCLIGSIIGTLIGIGGVLLYGNYLLNKEIKKLENLIEECNTFKIILKNEVFRKG